jgi:hypothetical protein
MTARLFGFLVLGIVLGGLSVELIHRMSAARPTPPVEPTQTKQQQMPGFLPPTAEQAYRLQDDCSKRGEEILSKNVIGSALTQAQVSRYNAITNRCYVLLTVHAANLDELQKYENANYFEDGQTGELLGWFTVNANQTKTYDGFECGDFDCVAEKVAACMKGQDCE